MFFYIHFIKPPEYQYKNRQAGREYMGELRDPFIATKHKIRANKGDNKSENRSYANQIVSQENYSSVHSVFILFFNWNHPFGYSF